MYSHNYYSDLRTKCISSTLPRRGSWRQTSNTWCNYNILPTSSFSLLTGIQRTMKLQRLQLFAQHRILTKKNQETVRPRPTKLIRLIRGKCSNSAYNGDVVITRVRIVARTLLLLLLIMSTKRSLHNNRVTGSNKLVLNNRFHSIYSGNQLGSNRQQLLPASRDRHPMPRQAELQQPLEVGAIRQNFPAIYRWWNHWKRPSYSSSTRKQPVECEGMVKRAPALIRSREEGKERDSMLQLTERDGKLT